MSAGGSSQQRGRCPGVSASDLLRAIDEFNRGDWYDCHETLENLWLSSKGDVRRFYQGFLQIAAALHHWKNGNFNGAVNLLAKGSGHLRHLPGLRANGTVRAFLSAVDHFRNELVSHGTTNMARIAPALIPRYHHHPD